MSELNRKLQALSQQQGVKPADLQPAIVKPLPRRFAWHWLGLGVVAMSLTGAAGWWLGTTSSATTPTIVATPTLTEIPTSTTSTPSSAQAVLPVLVSDAPDVEAMPVVEARPVSAPETVLEPIPETVPGTVSALVSEPATAPVVNAVADVHVAVPKVEPVKPVTSAPVTHAQPIAAEPQHRDVAEASEAKRTSAVMAAKPANAEVKKATLPKSEQETRAQDPTSGLHIETVELDADALAQVEYKKAEKALKQGDSRRAMQALEAALEYQPDWVLARQKLAALYYGRKDNRRAMAILQQGLQRDSGQSELRVTIAKLLVNESQEQAALSVLQAMPDDGNSRYLAMRGALAQQLHQPALALSSYQRLVSDQPYDGRWWMGLGIALERTQALATGSEAKVSADSIRHAYQQALLMGQISNQSQQFIQQRLAVLASKKG